MSHIAKKRRSVIDASSVGNCKLLSNDELSYAALILAKGFIEESSPESPISKYQAAVGALESAKQQIFKLYIQPHEKQAQHDNGEL